MLIFHNKETSIGGEYEYSDIAVNVVVLINSLVMQKKKKKKGRQTKSSGK